MDEREQRPCTNGCVARGTENTDTPRLLPARHGRYCDRCYMRVWRTLEEIPALIEHVVSLRHTAGSADRERVDTSAEAPAPGNMQALHDADDLYALTVGLATTWARRLGGHAPRPGGSAHWAGDVALGLAANLTPARARDAAAAQVRWLHDHLDEIHDTRNPGHIQTLTEQLRDVWRINARWPRRPQAYYSKLPCPDDGNRIGVYPPTFPGAETVYRCEHCGRVFDETNRAFFTRVFAEMTLLHGHHLAGRRIRTSEKVRRHLAGLYGTAEKVVTGPINTRTN